MTNPLYYLKDENGHYLNLITLLGKPSELPTCVHEKEAVRYTEKQLDDVQEYYSRKKVFYQMEIVVKKKLEKK